MSTTPRWWPTPTPHWQNPQPAPICGVGLKTLAQVIHPYPTQAEAIRKIADAYNHTRLTPTIKKLFNRWFAWQRG